MLKKNLFTFISSIVLLTFLTTGALAEDGNLPGGTAVSVAISTPDNTSLIANANNTATLNVAGSASIGIGQANADTSLIFVLDASGSTEESSGLNLSCPDQNPSDVDPGDPVPDENDIIDCEIAAAIALNRQAIALNTVDEVAMIMFAGDAVAADGNSNPSYQPLIAPNADHDNNGRYDVHEVLQSIQVAFLFGDDSGFGLFNAMPTPDIVKTDYADALKKAGEIAAQASNENVIIFMISDGVNNAGSHVSTALPISVPGKNIIIHSFAIPDSVGYGGTCASDRDGRGSLQEIVDLQNSANTKTVGKCHLVSDPSTLPDLLPELIVPTMDQLTIQIDGGAERPFTPAELSLPLPQDGPVDVQFETAVSGLALGEHQLCVKLYGTDTGGEGTIADCITVNVTSPLADLAIQSSFDSAAGYSSSAGALFMFEIENLGPANASNVQVTEILPDGALVGEITAEQGSCTNNGTTVFCELGDMAVGDSIHVTIQLETNCATNDIMEATVSATEEDPELANNTAVVNTSLAQIDHGDAPLATYADATHCDFSMEWLGLTADGESTPHDVDLSDDGFTAMKSGYPNQRLRATISTSGLGADRYGTNPDERLYLAIWVDYNQDGDWDDEGERAVFCDVAPGTRGQCNGRSVNWRPASKDSLTFQIRFRLRNPIPDETWIRARLTYGEEVGPTGPAEFGEVEDFTADLFTR